jgi:hypothetical protein
VVYRGVSKATRRWTPAVGQQWRGLLAAAHARSGPDLGLEGLVVFLHRLLRRAAMTALADSIRRPWAAPPGSWPGDYATLCQSSSLQPPWAWRRRLSEATIVLALISEPPSSSSGGGWRRGRMFVRVEE